MTPDPSPSLPAVSGRPPPRPLGEPGPFEATGAERSERWRWLALGASIGGPTALCDLLSELPSPSPLRIVIVQHILPGFDLDLADWLARALGLDVRVALDAEQPQPGSMRVAPAGTHLVVRAENRLALDAESPLRCGHRPSVDELFLSLASIAPHETIAVLLSGTGVDGAEGLLALRHAGAFCLAQDEASSEASGMPGAASDLGAAELVLSPRVLGLEIARRMAARA
jgi:chemotaxis response regulator CheB